MYHPRQNKHNYYLLDLPLYVNRSQILTSKLDPRTERVKMYNARRLILVFK